MPIPTESMPPQRLPTGTQKARKALKDAPRRHPQLLLFLVVSVAVWIGWLIVVPWPTPAYAVTAYITGVVLLYACLPDKDK